MHVLNVYSWVSLDICKHTWYHHHKQGNKHTSHLQKMYPFKVQFAFQKPTPPYPAIHTNTQHECVLLFWRKEAKKTLHLSCFWNLKSSSALFKAPCGRCGLFFRIALSHLHRLHAWSRDSEQTARVRSAPSSPGAAASHGSPSAGPSWQVKQPLLALFHLL